MVSLHERNRVVSGRFPAREEIVRVEGWVDASSMLAERRREGPEIYKRFPHELIDAHKEVGIQRIIASQ